MRKMCLLCAIQGAICLAGCKGIKDVPPFDQAFIKRTFIPEKISEVDRPDIGKSTPSSTIANVTLASYQSDSKPSVIISDNVDIKEPVTAELSEVVLRADQPITLGEILDLGMQNNPAIKELIATTQKAAGFREQVGLYANPSLGYSGQQLIDRGTDQHLIYAQQEFVTGGKLKANRAVLNEAVRAQTLELEAQQHRVAADLESAFYEVLSLQIQLEMTKQFIVLSEKGVSMADQRFQAKEASKIDLLQTRILRNEVELNRRQLLTSLDAKWKELAAIAGVEGMPLREVEGELPINSEQLNWEEFTQMLVNNSPEFAAAQVRVNQSRLAINRQSIQAIPNITVNVGAGVDQGTNASIMNLQVGAPIPVFNKNQGNISAAQAEYWRAVHDSERIENSIRSRIAIMSGEFGKASQAISMYQNDILPDAKEALNLAEEAYRVGSLEFVQLLVARRTYFDANLLYVSAQARLAIAKVRVDNFGLSGGLESVNDRSGDDSLRGMTFSQQ